MSEATRAKFLSGNLFRHVTVMSLTGSVGLMAVFLVDLASMLFISMLGKPELAAAIGYAGTIMFFLVSFGIGASVAAGATVAIAIGQRNPELARSKTTHAVWLSLAMGILLALIAWATVPWMMTLLGATGQVHSLAVHFLNITLASLPLLAVGMVGGAVLRAHGDAAASMTATLWGAAVAGVVNPLLIFGFDMGLTGAAIAMFTSRVVIALVSMWQVHRRYQGLQTTTLRATLADMRPMSQIAIPAILAQVATPLGFAIVTRFMSAYGEEAVAGMAVTGRLTPVAFGVIFALAGSIGPIIGQNYGAKQFDRVKAAFNASLQFSALVTIVMTVILFATRGPISDAFHAEGIARDIIYLFCGPLSALWFFVAIIFVANAAFNNLGRPFISTWTNWARATIGTLIPVWIGSEMAGALGVMWGQAITGVIFGILSWWLALRLIAEQTRSSAASLRK